MELHFFANKRQQKNIILKFELINDRIAKLRMKENLTNITFINTYAPTENFLCKATKYDRENTEICHANYTRRHECPNRKGRTYKTSSRTKQRNLRGTQTTDQIVRFIILITKRRVKDVIDVRTYRGANADTDHFLVITKIKE
ncbi:hypothetical protein ILUMI_11193 [Ignelater luminosus]|uniref:Uncharacterized protein n=1 Tax=Ignelater luminosus TaxID=2038154 RepID=A0A8K0G7Y4_IGNLU|nr:hypothetical protein ILUMI_11193 [Ignelater luminosus]